MSDRRQKIEIWGTVSGVPDELQGIPNTYTKADMRAIQGLSDYGRGVRDLVTPRECRQALDWIIYCAAMVEEYPFRVGQSDVRDYVLGRQFVGQELMNVIESPELVTVPIKKSEINAIQAVYKYGQEKRKKISRNQCKVALNWILNNAAMIRANAFQESPSHEARRIFITGRQSVAKAINKLIKFKPENPYAPRHDEKQR